MNNEQYFYEILQDYNVYLEKCKKDGNEAMDLISFGCLGYDVGEDDILCGEFIQWTKKL